jgi:hypothetical protein
VALLLVNIISVHISTTSFIAPLEDLATSLKHKIKVRSAGSQTTLAACATLPPPTACISVSRRQSRVVSSVCVPSR